MKVNWIKRWACSLAVDAVIASIIFAFAASHEFVVFLAILAAIFALSILNGLRTIAKRVAQYFVLRDEFVSNALKAMRLRGYPRDYSTFDFASYAGELMRDTSAPVEARIAVATDVGVVQGMRAETLLGGALAEHLMDRAIREYTE